MKMIFNYKRVLLLFFYFLIALTSVVFAQKTDQKLFAVVDVIVEDTTMIHSDSLEFMMSKDNINSNSEHNMAYYPLKMTALKTRMIIPLANPITYGRIALENNIYSPFKQLNHGNDLFIFQAGDTLELHIPRHPKGILLRGKDVFFTGKDAEKYNCMYKIGKISDGINNDKFNAFGELKNYKAAYASLLYSRDSLYNLQLGILNEYKNKLKPEIYNLIKIDCWATCNNLIVGFCYGAFNGDPNEQYEEAARHFFLKYYANYKEIHFRDSILLVKSYNYGDFLNLRNHVYPEIMSEKIKGHRNVTFADINSVINSHYQNGILKDKLRLLALLDLNWKKEGDFTDYIDLAIKEAGNNAFKTAMMEIKDSLAIGGNAFPFNMPDKNGKIYSLKDFKGKLLVIDFWFTGCHGCLNMAETLKPIAAFYKSNPNVVFATISIDWNKDGWLKSLQSEKYCSDDEINLLEGIRGQSSFVKHYHINEYPTLLIISKEGKVLSVTPPDPSNTEVFKQFLNQFL